MLRLRPRRRRTLQSRERQASHRRRLGRRPRRRPACSRLGTAGRKDGGSVSGTLTRPEACRMVV
jgi:hypothetical protein